MIGGRLEAFCIVPSGATVSATNAGGGPTSVSLTAGRYTLTQYAAHLAARLNAVRTGGTWTVTISTGQSGTGLGTINCTGTWALTFTTAETGTVLGFVGNIASRSSAATGTQNVRGIWLPDCPIWTEQEPRLAPKQTDNRSSESPQGEVITLGGTKKYQHKNLRWSHVTVARIREGSATTTYASLEQWFNDTQFGDGHTWFERGSKFQAYWDNGGTDTLLGADMNSSAGPTYGWALSPAVEDFDTMVSRVDSSWNGMWSVKLDRLVSKG